MAYCKSAYILKKYVLKLQLKLEINQESDVGRHKEDGTYVLN